MNWIKVSDRLPDYDDSYLTCNTHQWGAHRDYNKYYMIRKYYVKHKMFSNKFGNEFVTHWQPLPEPPNET